MLLVLQSQSFCPLQLLMHFIPHHCPINEHTHHTGEKQRLEDFPLLSGANPTAHVLHTEHTQQLSPNPSLLWALHSRRRPLQHDLAAEREADPRVWNIHSQRGEQLSHTALFTRSLGDKKKTKKKVAKKLTKGFQTTFSFPPGTQTQVLLNEFFLRRLHMKTGIKRLYVNRPISFARHLLAVVTCHRAAADLKEVPP